MEDVSDRLTAIRSMDRSELLAAWQQQTGCPPPRRASMKLLQSVLIWEAQAQAEGGLPPMVDRQLRNRAKQLFAERSPPDGQPSDVQSASPFRSKLESRAIGSLRPGVQLMREWNGRTYRVEVIEDGFVMDSKTYRSLTAIAKRITGAHWSGPRFFGLTDRRRASHRKQVSAA